ncbi:MAG: hypothetical protein FJ309_13020 [Planctomycetes bacterium]|nr:hypothetical protein [Planctomycetota bacterium]MBM4056779.1 hypothetical protein [Planctomycetota bacterium]
MAAHTSPGADRSGDLAGAVAALERRLDSTAAAAGTRRLLTSLAVAALVAGVGAYLNYLHSTVKKFAEPDVIVALAAATLEPRLDEEVGKLGQRLVAEAPAVLDHAEKALLDAPPQIVSGARDLLATQFDGQIKGLEEKVYTLVSGMLQESLARARREGINLDDDAQLDALVDASAPQIRAELKKAVDELYVEYRQAADGIGRLVERLTSGEPLDAEEQRQKEILVTGLAIIRKLENDPSRAPVQGVIRGDVPKSP